MNNFGPIEQAASSLIETIKEKYKDDPIVQKKVAIIQNSIQFSKSVVELAQLCSKKKKRIFQPINRMPKGRIERKKKIFNKLVEIQMGKMRHELILQTPIPRFPKGSYESGIVGESGPEIINLSRL